MNTLPEYGYIRHMKNEPILDYVLRKLAENKGRHVEISKATGIPYGTIAKITQRTTPNPGVNHIQVLADYFRGVE